LLDGKKVNLNLVERSELPVLKQWVNDVHFVGEFDPISQETLVDLEKQYDSLGGEKGHGSLLRKRMKRRLATLPISNQRDALQ